MAVTVTPIGVGDAFTKLGFETNYLVQSGDATLLIDCGTTASRALHALGKSIVDIDSVYISHLHLDHTAGLFELGIRRFFEKKPRPRLYLHSSLIPYLWDNFLKASMAPFLDKNGKPSNAQLDTFFEVIAFEHSLETSEEPVSLSTISARLVPVLHVPGMSCHGLVIENKVLITTDTIYRPEELDKIANRFGVEAIFHDCTFYDSKKPVHAAYSELLTLPQDLRSLLTLTHYEDDGPQRITADGSELELALGAPGEAYTYE